MCFGNATQREKLLISLASSIWKKCIGVKTEYNIWFDFSVKKFLIVRIIF